MPSAFRSSIQVRWQAQTTPRPSQASKKYRQLIRCSRAAPLLKQRKNQSMQKTLNAKNTEIAQLNAAIHEISHASDARLRCRTRDCMLVAILLPRDGFVKCLCDYAILHVSD
jgi:hypothetical protein